MNALNEAKMFKTQNVTYLVGNFVHACAVFFAKFMEKDVNLFLLTHVSFLCLYFSRRFFLTYLGTKIFRIGQLEQDLGLEALMAEMRSIFSPIF